MSTNTTDLANLIFDYYPNVRKLFRDLVSIKGVPISMTQLTCLNILNTQDKLSMTELAHKLDMSNQQLTKVVDALVDFGMANRIVDENNRRKIYAQITPNGKQTLASLRNEIDVKLNLWLKHKPDCDLDKLYTSLAEIAKYFVNKD